VGVVSLVGEEELGTRWRREAFVFEEEEKVMMGRFVVVVVVVEGMNPTKGFETRRRRHLPRWFRDRRLVLSLFALIDLRWLFRESERRMGR